MKLSPLLIRGSIVAALGGLLFGFDTAVISGTVGALQEEYNLTKFLLGFTVASALIGTILGAGIVKYPANAWGRKPTMVIIAVLYFVSAIGSAVPWDWCSFLFFRFLGGIGVGGASVVSPLYTAEISPAKYRGRLVAITQLNIVVGILLAFFSNYMVSQILTGDYTRFAWRVMYGVEAVPAAIFFVLLFSVKESPRWLLTKGRVDESRTILGQLGTDTGNVDEEITVIQNAIELEKQNGTEAFFQRKYRIPIFYAFLIAAFNQLSGINAILYYAPTVFKSAGASDQAAMFFPMIIGFVNLIVTIFAMFVIDHFGRRKLLFVGSLGYILSLGIVAGVFFSYGPQFDKIQIVSSAYSLVNDDTVKNWSKLSDEEKKWTTTRLQIISTDVDNGKYADTPVHKIVNDTMAFVKNEKIKDANQLAGAELKVLLKTVPATSVWIVLAALMLFIAAHAFGQGAIIWVFIGEIFPNCVRAQGQSLGSFTHWVFCAAISWSFPPLLAALGGGVVFAIYAGMMVLQLIWVIVQMPETKQIPLEEMQKKLGLDG